MSSLAELLNIEPPSWFLANAEFVNAGHARLIWNGLADGTRRGYRSTGNSYTRSCTMHSLPAWPASFESVCLWLTERLLGSTAQKPVKPDTALSDLSALRAYHIDHRLNDDLFDRFSKHFRRMTDGARRLQPTTPKRVREPISRPTVARISEFVSSLPVPTSPAAPLAPLAPEARDRLNVGTACRVAFAGFLRVGEFTYSAKDLANSRLFASTKLTRGDIRFSPTGDHAQLLLKRSKTDKNHEGVHILLAATNDAACPVAGLTQLFAHDPKPPSAPLFSLSSSAFTPAAFQSAVLKSLRNLGIDSTGIKGHSFRKGAAQHAHDAGILNEQIQALGRWSSEAFRVYFSTPPTMLYAWNRQFQTGSPTPVSNLPPSPPPSILGPTVHHGPSGGLPSE